MHPHVQKDIRVALRHFVDDYEFGDGSISLLAVQLRCAFIYLPYIFLDTEIGFAIPVPFWWSPTVAVVCTPSDAQVLLKRCMGAPEVFQFVAESLQM